jgi:hypothetical protein
MTFSKTHSSSVLAFPHSAEYAEAIEKPALNKDRIVLIACFIATVVFVAIGLLGMLPGGAL